MTPNDFCYWLQGFLEISNTKELTNEQLVVIKDHLQLVFEKKTPLRFGPPQPYTLCKTEGGGGGSTYVGGQKMELDCNGNKINGAIISC